MTRLDSRPRPYLIQRMTASPNHNSSGVDRYFSMDYMGSSEFEWGALPEALKRMRAALTDGWAPVEITHNNHSAYFVGPSDALGTAREFFADQLDARMKWRLQEPAFLANTYLDNRPGFKFQGWWAIDAHPSPWAIFRTKAHAGLWLKGLRDQPIKKA